MVVSPCHHSIYPPPFLLYPVFPRCLLSFPGIAVDFPALASCFGVFLYLLFRNLIQSQRSRTSFVTQECFFLIELSPIFLGCGQEHLFDVSREDIHIAVDHLQTGECARSNSPIFSLHSILNNNNKSSHHTTNYQYCQ